MESRDSKLIADGRAWRVDGRAQALVGPGLATPLPESIMFQNLSIMLLAFPKFQFCLLCSFLCFPNINYAADYGENLSRKAIISDYHPVHLLNQII